MPTKITNVVEYMDALDKIWDLWAQPDTVPGTPKGQEFTELVTAVEEYERLMFPLPKPGDPEA